jgi:spore maturation protein CgeB
MEFRQKNHRAIKFLVRNFVQKKWEKYIARMIRNEKDVGAVIFLTPPLDHFSGIPSIIKKEASVPVIFYDGDTPTSLPSYGGLSFSFYEGVDLSEYDAFIINSKGAADQVRELGAKEVFTVYWGVDPSVFCPIDGVEKVNDVGFYGIGSKLREEWITRMLVNPSAKLREKNFKVCGESFEMDLGSVQLLPLAKSSYRRFSCETRINLNIARKPHAEVYASSNSRVFELAAMGSCIVSNPFSGIEEWFEVGKEILIAGSEEQALELYTWLLSDENARDKMGAAARQRVLREHTHRHRAEQIVEIVKKLS